MKIAICITTRNRPEAFERTFVNWMLRKPINARIFVIDDASDNIYCEADYRFKQRAGIPRAKNKCLELAYKWGAEHIFLSDDDCYPISDNWCTPYIESGINHLCYTFTSGWNGTPSWNSGYREGNFIIHSLGCGCMMYIKRKCLDTVGGFDESFGLGKYEHVDYSRRIHNAGLTPHKFMDVIGSDRLFYSMDKKNEVERSFNESERIELLSKGLSYFNANANSKRYINFLDEYRK